MSKLKLKPCPFCGTPNPMCGSDRYVSVGQSITCHDVDCGAQMWETTPELAARAWNRRADPPVLECRVCGCKHVRVYELEGLPVIECVDCNRSWGRDG